VKETPTFGAVILAAGLSSRMGALKPCLPLGAATALERVAGSLRTAGVRDMVVVTGYERHQTAAEVKRLGLCEAHNPDYELGMFTSVQTGSRALQPHTEAFFVLPIDCPLVGPGVISALMSSYASNDDVIYPTCCGRRGHPPLLSARLRAALVAADRGGNLRAFLETLATDGRDVEVLDMSILLDMDTAEDYKRLSMFAEIIDRQRTGASNQEPRLSEEDALYLLSALEVEDRVIRHCQAVAAVAESLAEALNAGGSRLDVRLVRSAALLHDMAKGNRRHAVDGETMLARLGLPTLGKIVGSHMVLPDREVDEPGLSESQLVYLADKMVVEDKAGSLDGRTEYALRTYGHDDASIASIERRMQAARTIIAKIEAALGRSIEDVLSGPLSPTEP
jgi:molybdenum cofactor cytidylyltransferase